MSVSNTGAQASLPLALNLSADYSQALSISTPSPLPPLAAGTSASLSLLALVPNTTLIGTLLTGALTIVTGRKDCSPLWA